MATFNGISYTFASFAPYAYAAIWDKFWEDVLAEMDIRAGGMGGAVPAFLTGWDAGTADANPGGGKLRSNAATLAATTQLFIANSDALGSDVSAVVGLFDDSTSTTVKGLLRICHRSNPAKWALFAVTGAVTAATGYSKVPVSYIASPGGFAAGDPLALGFVRTGDKGDSGSGVTAATPNTLAQRDAAGAVSVTGLKAPGGASDSLAVTAGVTEQISDANWNYAQSNLRRRVSNAASVKMQSILLGGDNIADTTMGAYWASWLVCSSPPASGSTSAIVNKLVLAGPGDLDLRPSTGRLLLNGVSLASLISSTTFNAADKSPNVSLASGNKQATGSGIGVVRGTPAIPAGKWVVGFRVDTLSSAGGAGIAKSTATLSQYLGQDASGWAYDTFGSKVNGGSATAMGASLAVGDVLYVYLNTATGKIWFAKNGVVQASGDPAADTNPAFSGLSGSLYVACGPGSGTTMTLLTSAAELPYPIVSGFSPLP
ncbi:SPRY domain-containing protein [Azospirillum sp. BE72]|uniref:SPRY domain-containing protein n=1 Tax=Azospirillum sp. BE72 TaxID=2817776 RepID=UPI00285851BA|nr:SPRY domain-containing protein [Azospirillum sp. BE72]MDR6771786.1 hypothetical protein [Azospirillum sp. BE72]